MRGRCTNVLSVLVSMLLPMMLGVGLVASCGEADETYSRRPCFVLIDNGVHRDATLASVLTPYSSQFAMVSRTTKNGVSFFHIVTNSGTSSDIPFNAIDAKRSFIFGMNGAIIVGYSSGVDGIFYAYDRECPNCFVPDQLPLRSHPLSFVDGGRVRCANCQRVYDLNNGGIVATGDAGSSLTRYRASVTGAYGVMAVQ